jgi:hypothetical protein
MSRELRFVLILGGSIFALCVVAGIAAIVFLGSTVAKMERSSSPETRKAIAERIAPIPAGYRVESASEILSTLSATLKSTDGDMEIVLQSNTLPGASYASGNGDELAQNILRKTMQLAVGGACSKPAESTTERILVKDRTIVLSGFTCPGGRVPLKLEFGQFPGRAGLTTITAAGTPASWDAKAIREVLGAKP